MINTEPYSGTAYCVRCHKSVAFNGEMKTALSGRRISVGNCPFCDTRVIRIIGRLAK